MSLNTRRALDARWARHHRSVPAGFMVTTIEITRRVVGTWDPETGTNAPPELVWRGDARIQPNKDWRVRYAESGLDPQLMQIVRVQIPLRPGNMPPPIHVMDQIRVLEADPYADWTFNTDLQNWRLVVRNMINSSNPWLRNLSAVVDVSDPLPRGD